ncbi:MAG: sulfotransferase family 2 domain-containing protein [Paracoccaceae bacterium]
MLLSTSHEFIFIHIPKTAGSSITNLLEPYCVRPKRTLWRSLSRRLPFREAVGQAHFRVHERAEKIRSKLPDGIYGRFTTFAVVRNPYDHAVSHYEYMKQYRSAKIAARFEHVSFEDYLRLRARPRGLLERQFVNLPDQSFFVTDSAGKLIVDRILRFESLADDLRRLQDDLRLDPVSIPHENKTRARSEQAPTASYFTDETRALLLKVYERDFELFGYSTNLT